MADQNKLKKRLDALLKLPDNTYCADCRKRGPRWASANLGIFICIECSGIHRNLGVHISFVRSVNLDSWTLPQVEFMEEWGNKRANEYYEANMPAHIVRPKEGDPVRVVERFIRDKYEHKRYMASKAPPKAVAAAAEQPHHAAQTHARHPPAAIHRQPAAAAATAPVAPKPVPVAAPAPVVSLLDFDEPVAAPAPTVAQHDPFGSAAATHDFGDFMSGTPANVPPPVPAAVAAPAATAAPTAFPAWGMDASMPPAAPAKPHASADAILSLYSQPTHAHAPMGMGFGAQPMNPFAPQGHAMAMHGMPHTQPVGHQMMLAQQQQQQQFQQQQFQQQQQRSPVNPFMATQPRGAPVNMPMTGMPMQGMQGMQPMQGMMQPAQGYPQGFPHPQGFPMQGMQGMQSMPQGYPQQPVNPFAAAPPQQQQQQQAFSQLSWPTH